MEAQSKSSPTEIVAPPPPQLLDLKDATTLLIKHFDCREGLFDITFELQIAVGQFGATPETTLPGGAMLIRAIGLQLTAIQGPNTVDAAVVNPKLRKATRAKA